MQPTGFQALITPPWPSIEEPADYYASSQHRSQSELANFERNDDCEDNLDYIAVLGYN